MCLRCLAHRFRAQNADVGAWRMGGQGDRPGRVKRAPEPLARQGPADGETLPLKASQAAFPDDRTPHRPSMAPAAEGVRRSRPGRGTRCPAKGSDVPPCLRSIGLGSLASGTASRSVAVPGRPPLPVMARPVRATHEHDPADRKRRRRAGQPLDAPRMGGPNKSGHDGGGGRRSGTFPMFPSPRRRPGSTGQGAAFTQHRVGSWAPAFAGETGEGGHTPRLAQKYRI